MRRGLAVLTLALLVAGCEGTLQQQLGLERHVPDEFQAMRYRPLVIPEDFTLPPPRRRSQVPTDLAEREVRELLIGRASSTTSGLDPADRALLGVLPGKVDPQIRRRLAEDERRIGRSRADFLFVLPFQTDELGIGGTPLDPVAEARRLARDPRVRRVVTLPTGRPAPDGDG